MRIHPQIDIGVDAATVGIVGAGTMGGGIARLVAQMGLSARLYDSEKGRARESIGHIRQGLSRSVELGKIDPTLAEATLARITAVDRLDELAESDLVIEAVIEDLAVKLSVFSELSRLCPSHVVLGSNTSALSITEIAAAAQHPERVIGMHFFNPPHAMALIELVRAKQTSDPTIGTARALAKRLGKQVILVQDHPGFATSRLGIALGMEAIRMLEQGVASASDIDRAMELGYGHPMGPLRLTDLVGLDVRLAIADHLHRALNSPVFQPPQLLRTMVREGKLGKKTGEGFYSYR